MCKELHHENQRLTEQCRSLQLEGSTIGEQASRSGWKNDELQRSNSDDKPTNASAFEPPPSANKPSFPDEQSLANRLSPADGLSMADEPTIADEPSPAKQPFSANKLTPTNKSTMLDEPYLANEPSPADKPSPANKPSMADELSSNEPLPTNEPSMAHEPLPTDELLLADKLPPANEPLPNDAQFMTDKPFLTDELHLANKSSMAGEPPLAKKPHQADEPSLTNKPSTSVGSAVDIIEEKKQQLRHKHKAPKPSEAPMTSKPCLPDIHSKPAAADPVDSNKALGADCSFSHGSMERPEAANSIVSGGGDDSSHYDVPFASWSVASGFFFVR